MAEAKQELRDGLENVAEVPVHTAFAQVLAGDSQLTGAFLDAQVGLHPAAGLSLFGHGGYSLDDGWGVGVGLRYDFDL